MPEEPPEVRTARRGERGQSEREPRRGQCPHVQGGEAKSMDSLDLQWVKSKKGCCLLWNSFNGILMGKDGEIFGCSAEGRGE